jgi:hypothetical protein
MVLFSGYRPSGNFQYSRILNSEATTLYVAIANRTVAAAALRPTKASLPCQNSAESGLNDTSIFRYSVIPAQAGMTVMLNLLMQRSITSKFDGPVPEFLPD